MGIGAISTTFFTEKLYVQNKDSVEANNSGNVLLNKIQYPNKSKNKKINLTEEFEKLQFYGQSTKMQISGNNKSLMSQSAGDFSRVENEKYIIQKSSDMVGYWEIYDKEFDSYITINPNGANIQMNDSTGKSYLIAEEPGYGFCFASEMTDEMTDALKEFMHTDHLQTSSLDRNYMIRTDAATGIDTFTVVGQEGCCSQMMITNKEQMDRLQNLANVYMQKYPNLVTSNEMALNYFAVGEVCGWVSQTPNGVLITNQTSTMYMDDKNPDRDWAVFYEQSADTYNKIRNAMKEGLLGNLEDYDVWKEWFDDNAVEAERVLTDEEIAELLLQKK